MTNSSVASERRAKDALCRLGLSNAYVKANEISRYMRFINDYSPPSSAVA